MYVEIIACHTRVVFGTVRNWNARAFSFNFYTYVSVYDVHRSEEDKLARTGKKFYSFTVNFVYLCNVLKFD